jgi:hypothetical protein
MKAFNNSVEKQFQRLASSFSLSEKLAGKILLEPAKDAKRREIFFYFFRVFRMFRGLVSGNFLDHDERRQPDILTWGIESCSRLPSLSTSGVPGVCSPSQWRNRPRISRGSQCWQRLDGEPSSNFQRAEE